MYYIKKHINQLHSFICILSVFIIQSISFSQSYDYKNYTVTDGLLQSTVNDIKQDKNGFLWIATDGGLSKFDGNTFKNYSTQNGLTETAITSIIFDKDGALWIGTATGKIFIFENEKFNQLKIIKDTLCKRIINLFIDSKNRLWAATEGIGIIRVNIPNTNKHEAEYKTFYDDSRIDAEIHQVSEDNEGIIWFISQRGIGRYNDDTKSFEIFSPSTMPRYYYTSMWQHYNGSIIFGTYSNGLCLLDPKTANVFFYDESNGLAAGLIPFAKQDSDSNIWVSTWDKCLTKISKKGIQVFSDKNGLPSNKIRCMFQDNEHNIWFGTQDNGIIEYYGNKFTHYSRKDGLSDNVVNAVTRVGEKIFIGTNNGISIIDNGVINNVNTNDYVGSNLITDFATGNNNQLYVSTFSGSILVLNTKTLRPVGELQLRDNLVNALHYDENNVLWVATNKGVSFFKNNENLLKTPVKAAQLDDIEAVSFFKDSKSNLWIGTRRNGLIKVTNNKIKYYTQKEGLNHKSPTSVTEDSEGIIWIGTEGGGVYSFSNEKFTNYASKEGLLSDYVTTINYKNNALWIGTNRGICKYDLIQKKYLSFNQFDGFKELEVKQHASFIDDDKIWFGTINGLTTLNLNELKPNTIAPKINLSKFEIYGKEYPYPTNLVLNYLNKDITFYFSAISFSAPEKVVYQYKLQGFEEQWHTSNNTKFATYTNLVYGYYTLQIKAMNGDGVWSGITTYSFEIDAPFWMKNWFWILVIIFVIGGVVYYGQQRRKKLIKDKQILELQVKERTKEIEEKNEELVTKNVDISLKNKEITDSINYAKRLQESILPSNDTLKNGFEDVFVLYKPKAIVSGDFYWFAPVKNENKENEFLLAAADCTGHGVPGAFMCMVASSLLNQIVVDNRIYEPAEILKNLNNGIRSVLKQQETETRDGMDIAICKINVDTKIVEFAGALRPLYIFRDFRNEEQRITDYYFEELKADKYPIGGLQYETVRKFQNKTIKLNKGDSLFMFSDGFADQFGGSEGKKLMTKKFKEILYSIQPLSMEEQRQHLDSFFMEWLGNEEQIDDVMIIGVRM